MARLHSSTKTTQRAYQILFTKKVSTLASTVFDVAGWSCVTKGTYPNSWSTTTPLHIIPSYTSPWIVRQMTRLAIQTLASNLNTCMRHVISKRSCFLHPTATKGDSSECALATYRMSIPSSYQRLRWPSQTRYIHTLPSLPARRVVPYISNNQSIPTFTVGNRLPQSILPENHQGCRLCTKKDGPRGIPQEGRITYPSAD